ncbi:hypothetical protein SAMN04487934_10783 [Eubacterium ruminantium]|nr:hypothetical protein SAMN04487934_10783 [Eubacterium ruminantium]
MERESYFQKNLKIMIYIIAGFCFLCRLISLFSEPGYFIGIGKFIDVLYHLSAMACLGLIVFLITIKHEDVEKYGSYAIAGQAGFDALTGISLLVMYIKYTKGTDGLSVVLIIFMVLIILLEIAAGLSYAGYGMDRVTSLVPLILTPVVLVLRNMVYGRIDSKLQDYGGERFKESLMSPWLFLSMLFFILFSICLIILLDIRFLSEFKSEPKKLFTKNAYLGTYTNLYKNEADNYVEFHADKLRTEDDSEKKIPYAKGKTEHWTMPDDVLDIVNLVAAEANTQPRTVKKDTEKDIKTEEASPKYIKTEKISENDVKTEKASEKVSEKSTSDESSKPFSLKNDKTVRFAEDSAKVEESLDELEKEIFEFDSSLYGSVGRTERIYSHTEESASAETKTSAAQTGSSTTKASAETKTSNAQTGSSTAYTSAETKTSAAQTGSSTAYTSAETKTSTAQTDTDSTETSASVESDAKADNSFYELDLGTYSLDFDAFSIKHVNNREEDDKQFDTIAGIIKGMSLEARLNLSHKLSGFVYYAFSKVLEEDFEITGNLIDFTIVLAAFEAFRPSARDEEKIPEEIISAVKNCYAGYFPDDYISGFISDIRKMDSGFYNKFAEYYSLAGEVLMMSNLFGDQFLTANFVIMLLLISFWKLNDTSEKAVRMLRNECLDRLSGKLEESDEMFRLDIVALYN